MLQIGLGFLVANQHRQDGSSATNASRDEAWIVLEAGTESRIYAGLKPGTTRDDLRRELRGGTHLLLLEADQLAGEGLAESLTGQFHESFSKQFDLMIKGKRLNELKKYRLELISRGIAAGEIPDETFLDIIFFA